jgi:hypothetical protein
MNLKLIITTIMVAALSHSVLADDHLENKTVTEAMVELKNSISHSSKMAYEEFKAKASALYSQMSDKINELSEKTADKKDVTLEAMIKKREELKLALAEYKEDSKAKNEEMREKLVAKLEVLNQDIANYNAEKEAELEAAKIEAEKEAH